MLSAKERADLAKIVGGDWLCDDPCMADTYAFYMNPEVLIEDGGRFAPRPAAVILPQSTEEISQILAYCNTNELMAKPLSTGFGTWAAASNEKVLLLDLRRMNKILEIDEKNGIAVIEPYVRAIDLQTRIMEKGWNVHVVSCGGNHSILASVCAAWGYGVTGSSMSYSGRNLLGVQWVLPSGQIVSLGSSVSGGGWFTADGPGPSLRGIMRGFSGTFGGLGVFTKCAVKLYPWHGPKKWSVRGASPTYCLDRIPPRMSMNVLAFPDRQAMKDVGYLLGEAEIDFAQFRTPAFFSALGMSDNNQELKEILDTGIYQKITRWTLVNALVARSDKEFAWKTKALRQILKETGGLRLPLNAQPSVKVMKLMAPIFRFVDDPAKLLRRAPALQDMAHSLPLFQKQRLVTFSRLFFLLVRNAINTQATFRPSQGMGTTLGSFDTWDLGVAQSDWIAQAKKEAIEKGLILDDGGDLGCGGTFENGHLGYLEGIILYNTKDPASVRATASLIDSGVDAAIKHSLGVPIAGFGVVMNKRFGPHCSDYDKWLGRIKKALDPNTASDPFFYAQAKE